MAAWGRGAALEGGEGGEGKGRGGEVRSNVEAVVCCVPTEETRHRAERGDGGLKSLKAQRLNGSEAQRLRGKARERDNKVKQSQSGSARYKEEATGRCRDGLLLPSE